MPHRLRISPFESTRIGLSRVQSQYFFNFCPTLFCGADGAKKLCAQSHLRGDAAGSTAKYRRRGAAAARRLSCRRACGRRCRERRTDRLGVAATRRSVASARGRRRTSSARQERNAPMMRAATCGFFGSSFSTMSATLRYRAKALGSSLKSSRVPTNAHGNDRIRRWITVILAKIVQMFCSR